MDIGTTTIFSLAVSLFLLMDPIGNVPIYVSLLQEIPPKKQKRIIFRELLIALFAIILFAIGGEVLLNFLGIKQESIQLSGGIILFIMAIRMIFPNEVDATTSKKTFVEPFIVPLAIPLIAGPSLLAAVMVYSLKEVQMTHLLVAILLAWGASMVILLSSTHLKKVLGKRGITACERLMGFVLLLISLQMILDGVKSFLRGVL